MKCPACGFVNAAEMKFCGECAVPPLPEDDAGYPLGESLREFLWRDAGRPREQKVSPGNGVAAVFARVSQTSSGR